MARHFVFAKDAPLFATADVRRYKSSINIGIWRGKMGQCSVVWSIGMFFLGSGVTLMLVFIPFNWPKFRWQQSKEMHKESLRLTKLHIRKLENDINYRFRFQFGSSLAILFVITLANILGVFSKAFGEFLSLKSNPFILISPSIALLIVACIMIFIVMKDIDRVSKYQEFVKRINKKIKEL